MFQQSILHRTVSIVHSSIDLLITLYESHQAYCIVRYRSCDSCISLDRDPLHTYDVHCNRSKVQLQIPTLARCYRGYTVSIDRMSYRRIVSTLLLLLQKPTDPTYPLFSFYVYTQRGKLRPAGAGPFYPLPYGRGEIPLKKNNLKQSST